jgi:hypothetical protein
MKNKSSSYFLPININKNDVINPSWVRPNDVKVEWRGVDYVKDMLTTEFFEKLGGLTSISGAMIFNKINHKNPSIAHADVFVIEDELFYKNYGLNIVFDESTDMPGTMRWFSINNPKEKPNLLFTIAKTPYLNFDNSEITLEQEHVILDTVTLVRTDVPHSISSGNGIRTCISIRFKHNFDWDIAYDHFNKMFNQ